jgi:hypothetical protein
MAGLGARSSVSGHADFAVYIVRKYLVMAGALAEMTRYYRTGAWIVYLLHRAR